MVERRKVDYVNSKRLDKPLVALDIIRQWREQKPPGRFLKFDEKTDTWSDVGDKKAREKTSQALREKAPLLRKQQEEQRKEALGVVMEDSITSIPESGPSSSFRKGGSGSSSVSFPSNILFDRLHGHGNALYHYSQILVQPTIGL